MWPFKHDDHTESELFFPDATSVNFDMYNQMCSIR